MQKMSKNYVKILLVRHREVEYQEHILFKADLHLPQWSGFSAVYCVNTEIENFLSLCGNTTLHCRILTSVNEPLKYLGQLVSIAHFMIFSIFDFLKHTAS